MKSQNGQVFLLLFFNHIFTSTITNSQYLKMSHRFFYCVLWKYTNNSSKWSSYFVAIFKRLFGLYIASPSRKSLVLGFLPPVNTALLFFLLILWPRGWDTEPGGPAIKSGKREMSQNVMSFGELCLLLLLLSEKQNGSDVRCCFWEQHIPFMPFCCPSVTTRTVKGGFGIKQALASLLLCCCG